MPRGHRLTGPGLAGGAANPLLLASPNVLRLNIQREKEAHRFFITPPTSFSKKLQIAEEGAEGARRRGYNAAARIAQASESVAKTIDEIALEIDAGLVVCGQRGRGAIGSALLGSVSHALAAHTKRPLLIAPQHPS